MEQEIKTMTVGELLDLIVNGLANKVFKSGDRIYLSSDEEGNSFGTLTADSFGREPDGRLFVYPFVEHLDYSETK